MAVLLGPELNCSVQQFPLLQWHWRGLGRKLVGQWNFRSFCYFMLLTWFFDHLSFDWRTWTVELLTDSLVIHVSWLYCTEGNMYCTGTGMLHWHWPMASFNGAHRLNFDSKGSRWPDKRSCEGHFCAILRAGFWLWLCSRTAELWFWSVHLEHGPSGLSGVTGGAVVHWICFWHPQPHSRLKTIIDRDYVNYIL